jgi:hypothetical protein
LLFERVLAFVEQPLAFVKLGPHAAKFLLAFGLGREGRFLDFQFGFAAAVFDVLLRLADDLLGFRFRVAAAQMF